jgi:hypothetical protein
MTTRIHRRSPPAREAGQVNVWIAGDDEVIVNDPGRDAAAGKNLGSWTSASPA